VLQVHEEKKTEQFLILQLGRLLRNNCKGTMLGRSLVTICCCWFLWCRGGQAFHVVVPPGVIRHSMIRGTSGRLFPTRVNPSLPLGDLSTTRKLKTTRTTQTLAVVMDPNFSTLMVAEGEGSWRQYVSLALIAGVLIDILLGSPLANTLLKPMRGDDETDKVADDDESGWSSRSKGGSSNRKSKERVDSEAVAKAAIAKAQGVLELRKFLDESKSDWDRFEDMKRKIDSEMENLDANLAEREEDLAKRRGNN